MKTTRFEITVREKREEKKVEDKQEQFFQTAELDI